MIAKAVEPKIEISLSDPGMTMLHRAGVAGLYMTLKALAKRYPTLKSRQRNFKWTLTENSISFYWKGDDYTALQWFFSESFQISDDGFISLAGLQNQTWENQLITHIGICNTFLQHTSVLKFDGKVSQSLTLDGLEVVVDYQKAKYYIYQDYAKKLCNTKGQLLTKPIGIKGWLYPGATLKHEAFARTQFKESLERAIALLFAPVACLYFINPKSHLHETKTQYCLVIPDITNLKLYAKQRKKLNSWNYQQFSASGYSDAGMRFLANQRVSNLAQANNFRCCKVITFGRTKWTGFQKVRKGVEIIKSDDLIINSYRLCDRYFQNRVVEWEDGNFIAASIVRELISENLAKGFPWWHNFTHAVRSNKLFGLIGYEKKGLQQMVKNAQWDEKAQKLFVEACHEALLKIYGKLYSRAKEGEYIQIERENERIRSGLIRCQNSEDFRHFMTANFWSKAGNISILAEHWEELMPLTTKPDNWKLARDLALLSLASYKKKPKPADDSPSKEQALLEEE
ncbi:MAG: type I-MYXAN CRISPR-associated Cas8a1/Cmx1 [Pleurocapsa sp.]